MLGKYALLGRVGAVLLCMLIAVVGCGHAPETRWKTVQLNKQTEVYKAFEEALNNACGEISEAARLSPEIFEGDELKPILRELARLMEIIDARILKRSVDDEE